MSSIFLYPSTVGTCVPATKQPVGSLIARDKLSAFLAVPTIFSVNARDQAMSLPALHNLFPFETALPTTGRADAKEIAAWR